MVLITAVLLFVESSLILCFLMLSQFKFTKVTYHYSHLIWNCFTNDDSCSQTKIHVRASNPCYRHKSYKYDSTRTLALRERCKKRVLAHGPDSPNMTQIFVFLCVSSAPLDSSILSSKATPSPISHFASRPTTPNHLSIIRVGPTGDLRRTCATATADFF